MDSEAYVVVKRFIKQTFKIDIDPQIYILWKHSGSYIFASKVSPIIIVAEHDFKNKRWTLSAYNKIKECLIDD